jgi:hypothetical protein
VGYQTDRSVTIDTKTGKFMKLKDFTSNTGGKVTAAVKTWYAKESHDNLSKAPAVAKNMKVCDRPGNVITLDNTQCFTDPYMKSGLVAWQARGDGLRLTFPAGEGPRYALLPWSAIPQKL